MTMNNKTLEIKGDWNIIRGKLKQKWAKLTDSDLHYAEGKAGGAFGAHPEVHRRKPARRWRKPSREVSKGICRSCKVTGPRRRTLI